MMGLDDGCDTDEDEAEGPGSDCWSWTRTLRAGWPREVSRMWHVMGAFVTGAVAILGGFSGGEARFAFVGWYRERRRGTTRGNYCTVLGGHPALLKYSSTLTSTLGVPVGSRRCPFSLSGEARRRYKSCLRSQIKTRLMTGNGNRGIRIPPSRGRCEVQ